MLLILYNGTSIAIMLIIHCHLRAQGRLRGERRLVLGDSQDSGSKILSRAPNSKKQQHSYYDIICLSNHVTMTCRKVNTVCLKSLMSLSLLKRLRWTPRSSMRLWAASSLVLGGFSDVPEPERSGLAKNNTIQVDCKRLQKMVLAETIFGYRCV